MELAPPPADLQHLTAEGLQQLIQLHARNQGYAVVKSRTKNDKKGELKTVWLICDRGRPLRESTGTKRIHGTSRRNDCPFEIVLRRSLDLGIWIIDLKNGTHNHTGSLPVAHPSQRKILLDQHKDMIASAVKNKQMPAAIVAAIRAQDNEDSPSITRRDIANEKARIRREALRGLTPTQALLKWLQQANWYTKYMVYTDTNEVYRLFPIYI